MSIPWRDSALFGSEEAPAVPIEIEKIGQLKRSSRADTATMINTGRRITPQAHNSQKPLGFFSIFALAARCSVRMVKRLKKGMRSELMRGPSTPNSEGKSVRAA